MFGNIKVLVRGAGDLASGVIHALYQSGFKVVATEIETPLVVRRTVSFAEAIYQGELTVEGVRASKVDNFAKIEKILADAKVPVIVDPEAKVIDFWKPQIVVDAIMAKKNLGTRINDAEIVIGLGPGFTAKEDVDAVIETNRGHDLGRIIKEGQAQIDTGVPGQIAGYSKERVLKSSVSGIFTSDKKIGEQISSGEVFGYIGNTAIKAEVDGVIRGLIKSGIDIKVGTKLGDIDPRGIEEYCYTISDKARTIAGSVITAILSLSKDKNNLF
ncbi:selenium-dependent molybdenum cofactor biosynthesis protein YqeB [Natroniella acetigena]|uniref:selenium-dependent molybdenum cofactor biosynthesis protein YqeB n=1 Tax=Natroniella acetigena TaxID=52004 RepID=UPI00200B51F8|nr:selenium-dependent molybdenum cofactor biosynthesis protein YqeB [Natroniella acetigena]MCK8827283.1 selenium-dependent molybdenum cofactor biosynthesis protein YqeB [Natroniella acetigena]